MSSKNPQISRLHTKNGGTLYSTAHPPTTTSQMKNVCGFVDLRPTFQ